MKLRKQSDYETAVESDRTRRIIAYGILFLLILVSASLQGCGIKGGSKPGNAELTAEAQLTETAILELVQETLGVLASETAETMPATATANAPSPFPTFTSTTKPDEVIATEEPETEAESTPTLTTMPPTSTSLSYYYDVNFREGGTSSFHQLEITNKDQHHYTIWAMEGQTLILNASSPNNDVILAVRGLQDGQHLLWPGDQVRYWTGRLPSTQNYLVTLSTTNPDTYYFLGIEVPANIFFDPGAYSDKIEGYINVDQVFHPDVLTRVRYLALALAEQKMTVKLSSPNLDALSLGIVGQADGKVYLNYEVKSREGEVVLPTTQGYYIDVYSVSGESTSYTLKVTIR